MLKMLLVITLVALAHLAPPPDSECLTDWHLDMAVENVPTCNGTFTVWSCQIQRWSIFRQEWYPAIKSKYQCEQTIYLPFITNCTPDPITGLCPVMSHLP